MRRNTFYFGVWQVQNGEDEPLEAPSLVGLAHLQHCNSLEAYLGCKSTLLPRPEGLYLGPQ